jgi:GR25 family glycosyltransferase involved in LPS biosynthesis
MADRPDRWHHISNLYGKHFNLIRVEATKHNEGWKGCFLSHKKCLQIAKENKLENIIVMEDDCIPFINFPDFINRVNYVKSHIDEKRNYNNWHIILGGVFSNSKINVKSIINRQGILYAEINKGFCTHLMFYNHSSYDFFIQHPLNHPIDHVWHNKLKAFVVLPFLANQRPNYSNITNKHTSSIFDSLVKTNLELLFLQKQKSSVSTSSIKMKLI